MDIVLDNIIFSRQKIGGISVYWSEIISRLRNNTTTNCIEIGKNSEKIFCYPDYKFSAKHIFHSSYFRISENKNAINILTIHDCIHMKKISLRNIFFHFFLKSKIKKSDVIICVSETTKNDVYHYYNIPSDKKVKVIYNGVNKIYYPIKNIKRNSILFVGDRSWYKNFNLAIKISKIFNEKLIIVGKPLKIKERKKMIENNISYDLVSNITNTELSNLYNSVKFFIYCSEFEGFGIPLIEAARCKCPIITLDRPFVKEVLGENTICVDVKSEILLEKQLNSLSENEINTKVNGAFYYSKKYDWDKTYEKLLKLYKNCYNNEKN